MDTGRLQDLYGAYARRHTAIVWVAMVLLAVVVGSCRVYQAQVPSREVARDLVGDDDDAEMLRYEVVDGVAHVVFDGRGGVRLDHVISDKITFEWPPQPAWQLSGDWCVTPGTLGPASVQPVPHETMELFGEINDPSIEVMEAKYDGEWHAYDVSQPGFFVRIPGLDEAPSGYRWLDGSGSVVSEKGKVAIPDVCPPSHTSPP